MNFNAKLPQFAPYNLQPSVIRDICIDAGFNLDLVGSDDDREVFRLNVTRQLNAYKRGAVRYAVTLMGGGASGCKWEYVPRKVANAWICQAMRQSPV